MFGIKIGNKKYNRAEIWYKIHSDFWNKGYATEVVNSIIIFCFDELKLHFDVKTFNAITSGFLTGLGLPGGTCIGDK